MTKANTEAQQLQSSESYNTEVKKSNIEHGSWTGTVNAEGSADGLCVEVSSISNLISRSKSVSFK